MAWKRMVYVGWRKSIDYLTLGLLLIIGGGLVNLISPKADLIRYTIDEKLSTYPLLPATPNYVSIPEFLHILYLVPIAFILLLLSERYERAFEEAEMKYN